MPLASAKCGHCVPWNYPRMLANQSICLLEQIECFDKAMVSEMPKAAQVCNCPFACNRLEYEYSMMQEDLNEEEVCKQITSLKVKHLAYKKKNYFGRFYGLFAKRKDSVNPWEESDADFCKRQLPNLSTVSLKIVEDSVNRITRRKSKTFSSYLAYVGNHSLTSFVHLTYLN